MDGTTLMNRNRPFGLHFRLSLPSRSFVAGHAIVTSHAMRVVCVIMAIFILLGIHLNRLSLHQTCRGFQRSLGYLIHYQFVDEDVCVFQVADLV